MDWSGRRTIVDKTLVDQPKADSGQKCATSQCFPSMPPGKWLMDTGCAYDLISQKLVGEGPTRPISKSEVITFATANGKVKSCEMALFACEELNTMVEPYVLKETPSVLSIGRRCMDMGYSFHWEAGRNPVLVTPEGHIIPLVVEKHIPYMIVGDEESLPRPPSLYRKVPVAPAVNHSVADSLESVGEQHLSLIHISEPTRPY